MGWMLVLSSLLGIGIEALTAALNSADKKKYKQLMKLGTEIAKIANTKGISYQAALQEVSDIKTLRQMLGNTSKGSQLLKPYEEKAVQESNKIKKEYNDALNKQVDNQQLINDLNPNKSLGEHVSDAFSKMTAKNATDIKVKSVDTRNALS